MKRILCLSILVFLLSCAVFLSRTALDPDAYIGQWYSAEDQRSYFFSEGLIYFGNKPEAESDTAAGAYVYCKKSIVLYAEGIDGLETEKELYLVRKDRVCFLCENPDGSGPLYFIRYQN